MLEIRLKFSRLLFDEHAAPVPVRPRFAGRGADIRGVMQDGGDAKKEKKEKVLLFSVCRVQSVF